MAGIVGRQHRFPAAARLPGDERIGMSGGQRLQEPSSASVNAAACPAAASRSASPAAASTRLHAASVGAWQPGVAGPVSLVRGMRRNDYSDLVATIGGG